MSEAATTEEGADEEEEKPPIDQDERAEIDLSDITEKVAEETAPDDTDTSDDTTDEEDIEDGSTSDQEAVGGDVMDSTTEGADSLGDVYVGVLALLTASVVASQNDDVDVEEKTDDIVGMTTMGPFNLARDFDRLMDEQGGPKNLPPHVAVLLGSVTIFGAVILTETDLGEQLINRLLDNIDLDL